ncbi:MAG: hypothetical protein KDI46_00890, partial [Alphaproteobacteria bacterium]|nr:hypothetical protein [Alphaproteobacteria bacterium]
KAMGAIIRPYKRGTALAAALQFALEHNKVEEIIILGHTGCSAIRALINGINDKDISGFLDVAQRGVANAKRKWISEELPLNLHRHAEEQIVLLSAENITTYPSVAKALKEKRIQITPWLFDMDEGKILSYNPNSEEFEPIEMPSEDKENLE